MNMLTFEQLRKYYADARAVSPKSMLVEYVQYELLDSLFKQKQSRYLSFIGGTAIRIVYNGSRFSEDLDFDNFGLSFDEFLLLMDAIVKDMRLKGFVVEFRAVERNAYHCYVKFPHILRETELGNNPKEKILVRIDTMKKERTFLPVAHTLNKFDIYRNILVNPIDIILAQKLITILERAREKGRDFFDVSYLYGITQPNFKYIEQEMNMDRGEFVKKFIDRCDSMDFLALARDVEPFLMYPDQSARVIDFKNFIKKALA